MIYQTAMAPAEAAIRMQAVVSLALAAFESPHQKLSMKASPTMAGAIRMRRIVGYHHS